MSRPLEGIRVLELAVWHNGPAAGYMLADLGAEVIKLEQPGVGDPSRGSVRNYGQDTTLPGGRTVGFEFCNRGKKSITLDLKQEQGRQALYRLVEKSDVFFTNHHRSVQGHLGADYATLRRHNPRLIYAYNGGYGSLGPEGEKRVFDPLVQARSGLMAALAGDDRAEPVRVVGTVFDQNGATMLAYGIITALLVRERQGIGQEIEVSLFNSAIHIQGYNISRSLWQGRPFTRIPRETEPLYTYYRCADGSWLYIAESNSDLYWPEVCRALGLEELEKAPRFATSQGRRQFAQELIAIFDRIFATRDREDWLKHFEEQGCHFAYAPVNLMADLKQDPQVIANDYIVDFPHPTLGQTKAVGFPVRFSQTPCRIDSPPPELGQHTEEVLLEIAGYSWEELGQLRANGVI